MEIIKANETHLSEIMNCVSVARQIMRNNGNLTQWINGYPSETLFLKGMKNDEVYVCIDDEDLVGVFCFIRGVDPTYNVIHEGQWLDDEPYAVIHRLATNGKVKGLGRKVLDWCFKQHANIRVDTHKDNIIMQKIFEQCGFEYCGVIYLEDGSPRMAYQKINKAG